MKTKQRLQTEYGTIESLSPQGSKLYAIIRRNGDVVKDIFGENVKINTYLFGNILNLPETSLTMSEILIPINIDLDINKPKQETLIGKIVAVYLEDNIPKYAELLDDQPARIIKAFDILEARRVSKDITAIDDIGIASLKKKGYTDDQINLVVSENLGTVKLYGQILKYGNQVTHDSVSSSEQSSRYDMSQFMTIATNIPPEELKTKTCHIHIKAFSAK